MLYCWRSCQGRNEGAPGGGGGGGGGSGGGGGRRLEVGGGKRGRRAPDKGWTEKTEVERQVGSRPLAGGQIQALHGGLGAARC